MSKKNRSKNSSSQQNVNKNIDTFDVKENLKKIRSGSGNIRYETNPFIEQSENPNKFYGSENTIVSLDKYTTLTNNKFEKINEKFGTEFNEFNKSFNEHKEKTSEKLNEKLSINEFRFWAGGLISGIIFIGGIIYNLSYQPLVEDNRELKKDIDEIKDTIQLINFKLEQNKSKEEKTVPNKELLKVWQK